MQNLANFIHVLCTLSGFDAINYADFLCGFLCKVYEHLCMFYTDFMQTLQTLCIDPNISVYASFMQVLCKLCDLCVLEMFMHFMNLALC